MKMLGFTLCWLTLKATLKAALAVRALASARRDDPHETPAPEAP